MTQQAEYYAQRAAEYDAVYDKPERQADLTRLGAAARPGNRADPAGQPVQARQQHPDLPHRPDGDTYQRRRLADGRTFEVVVKNFPARDQLARQLAGQATGLRWTEFDYFWLAACSLR